MTDFNHAATPYRDEPIVSCPLCGTPHSLAAKICGSCGQDLREPTDYVALAEESAARKRQMAMAAAAFVGLIAFNVTLFHGGGFVLVLGPVAWFAKSWARVRTIDKGLKRRG